MASYDDSLKQIQLVPSEQFKETEDQALEKLKHIWPEIYDDVVMYLGLEKAVQRAEISRGQAS